MAPSRAERLLGAVAAFAGVAGAALAGDGPLGWSAGAALGAALALHRTRPRLATAIAVAGSALMVPAGSLTISGALLLFANAFAVGRWSGPVAGAVGGAALLTAILLDALVWHDAGVPYAFVVTTAWFAGRAIRDRDDVATRLTERGAELDREREAYAALSVRYERARIASELHDIVAHAISVMVVQAGAGQRLAAVDPELTAETFEAIGEAARQGEQDIARLVALLSDEDGIAAAPDLRLVEELVARAAGTGLDVRLRLEGTTEGLPTPVAETAFRVVRESLTNALRYASGASVDVLLRGDGGGLHVAVANGPAPQAAALAGHGTGNGLRGLREQLDATGGRLDAGPTADGGWNVAAAIPLRPATTSSASPSR